MALVDGATSPHGFRQKLLPEWQSQPRITPVLILDHSIVGSASGAYWYFHDSTGIESHFILCGKPSGAADGEIWQLMDTGRRADANNEANAYAISIETEDNGDPDDYPWSDHQLDSLVWLHDILTKYHPTISRAEANDCNGPGLGFHSKMGAPSCWTPAAGKTCPGKPVRVDQWNRILLPAFVNGTPPPTGEDDMTPEQARQLEEIYKGMVVPGTTTVTESFEKLFNRVKTLEDAIGVPGTTTPQQSFEIVYRRVQRLEDGIDAICENLGIPFDQVDTSTITG